MELFIVLLVLLVIALVVGLVAQLAGIARNRSEIEVLKVQRRRIGEVWDWVESLARRLERLEEMAGIPSEKVRGSSSADVGKVQAASGQGAGVSPPQARDALAADLGGAGLEDLPPAEPEVRRGAENPIPSPPESPAPLGSALVAWKKARQEGEADHAMRDTASVAGEALPEAESLSETVGDQDDDFTIAAVEAEDREAKTPGSARLGGSLALPPPEAPPESSAIATGADAPPRRRIGFEELLGGKVFVWIGAVALVLTGAFLFEVRHPGRDHHGQRAPDFGGGVWRGDDRHRGVGS